MESIYQTIPHREPFLFIDSIEDVRDDGATCTRKIRSDEPQFLGHYPGNPIMPGVLLCESVFQAAAIFICKKLVPKGADLSKYTPVLARIKDAKFKTIVRPGDTVTIDVQFVETLGKFHFIKGSIKNQDGKTVLTLECALAMIEEEK